MRTKLLCAFLLAACTKPNPNVCCVDAVDCERVGLADPKGCDDGLACRGNICVLEICETAGDCDASLPYCVVADGGTCQASCSDDSECPGFGQSADQRFCIDGTCATCRTDADCDAGAPVCASGGCRACAANDECASGACDDDGSCVDAELIAYAAPGGSASGQCDATTPCNLTRAVSLTGRPVVVMSAGTYQQPAPLLLVGQKRLVGPTSSASIENTNTGAIIKLQATADVRLENLNIQGARTGVGGDGNGIELEVSNLGAKLRVERCLLRGNARHGVVGGRNSIFESTQSLFIDNAGSGVELVDSTATIDQSTARGNQNGFRLDGGVYVVRNSFVVRNAIGIDVFPSRTGNTIEFTTIVDNSMQGVSCVSDGTSSAMFPNNIVARNGVNTFGSTSCSYPSSIILGNDLTGLNFVSPNAAPFDYHIQPGSIAIDAATITTIDHDFDGDPRPANAADIGADEL